MPDPTTDRLRAALEQSKQSHSESLSHMAAEIASERMAREKSEGDNVRLQAALCRLAGAILRREDQLRKGSQAAAVSIICTAREMQADLPAPPAPAVDEAAIRADQKRRDIEAAQKALADVGCAHPEMPAKWFWRMMLEHIAAAIDRAGQPVTGGEGKR